MNPYTIILPAKDILKIVNIPQDFLNYNVKVTVEPLIKTENDIMNDLILLFEKAKENKVNDNVDIDELMNSMNDALL
jgi:hypothetical protein